ncbi:MAG: Rrf2 family transcriptional regulator [Clostridia bacterium]|nr:Rrf2 family transcriptional regulator [Clostridia bacterium]
MKISTKGTYAVSIMTEIAKNENSFTTVSVLSSTTGFSEKYLEQIVSKLLKAKLLLSFRGSNGGYKLAKHANEISVGEILRATEGNMKSVSCMEEGAACDLASKCLTVNVWAGLNKVVNDYLNSVSLDDIVNKKIKVNN